MIYNENKEIHTTDNNKPKKVLDVTWNNKTDTLIYNFLDLIKEAKLLKPTKRNVLKILSSFYKPMRLIQPMIIIGLKILMQNICQEKLDWDDILSEDWHDCLTRLGKMGSAETHCRFEIGNNTNPVVKREFQGFCNASLNGCGACIYVKTIYKSGKVSVKLLSSKSRLAPLKQETIPRLELLGALLLCRLMLLVRNSLKDELLFDNVYYWCDSKIGLAWLKSTNKEFKAFIENRVTEI